MQFPYTSPQGADIWRGDLKDGFLRYKFGGPIFGGAYTWRGLFSEFYGTHEAERFRTDRSCLFSEINSNLNDWCSSFDSCYLNIFFLLPVQFRPSSVYPGLQRQAKDPLVLLQYV